MSAITGEAGGRLASRDWSYVETRAPRQRPVGVRSQQKATGRHLPDSHGVEEQRSHGRPFDPAVDVVAGGSEMTGPVHERQSRSGIRAGG